MTTAPQQPAAIRPVATAMRDPPAGEALTPEQWTTLLALADTVVPAVCRSSAPGFTPQLGLSDADYESTKRELRETMANPPDDAVLEQFLAESATTDPAFRRELHRTLAAHVRVDSRRGIAFLLNALNTRVGSLLFNGSTRPFHEHSYDVRLAILRSWSVSYLPQLRLFTKALTSLARSTYLRTSPTIAPLLDYPRAPVHGQPGQGFDFAFPQFAAGDRPEVLEADVVIVGSGCGAGVVAKNLAEDGHDVLVVEKAYHYAPEHLPMTELAATHHLFHDGGVTPSDDGSMRVFAASAWGGGGTVNWSASLQTQGRVRREWADGGLGFFTSADFQASLDRVCRRMGVSAEHVEHNHGNRVLLEGARRLGYSARPVPQNTGGAKHYCGYCSLGCGSNEKQGPAASWLPDAIAAGARTIEGLEVRDVAFEDRRGVRTAVGVRGTWRSRDHATSREIVVRARRVILSAGTLFSPLILLRSGLRNPQIGRNLKLHPVVMVYGVWPDDVRPWEGGFCSHMPIQADATRAGGILTSVCDEFQDQDGAFHGAKLEATTMLPSLTLPLFPQMGLDFKRLLVKFKRMNGFISLTRDHGSGRVYPDATTGLPRIAYTTSAVDRKHCLEGVLALAKICYITGATEIHAIVDGISPFVRSAASASAAASSGADEGINDAAFQAWLARLRAVGLTSPENPFCSAHQMGSCRMGTSERASVVDPRGKVWGTAGLYVADASVFPSASGVNPMITNMAISDWISRGVGRELRREKGGLEAQAVL
ncbi:MAG: hypothetical protein M1832_004387 [Thelocarpon impressellum]|nr:MAG: hypothetical protein M1832_004387 [Thelocarpon impressellum]